MKKWLLFRCVTCGGEQVFKSNGSAFVFGWRGKTVEFHDSNWTDAQITEFICPEHARNLLSQ